MRMHRVPAAFNPTVHAPQTHIQGCHAIILAHAHFGSIQQAYSVHEASAGLAWVACPARQAAGKEARATGMRLCEGGSWLLIKSREAAGMRGGMSASPGPHPSCSQPVAGAAGQGHGDSALSPGARFVLNKLQLGRGTQAQPDNDLRAEQAAGSAQW